MNSCKFLSMQGMGRGTSRRLVEGRGRSDECVGDRVHIMQHVGGRDADEMQAPGANERGPPEITFGPIATAVDLSVDLDRKLCGGAVEVEHVRTERVLTTELDAAGRTTEPLPEEHLR